MNWLLKWWRRRNQPSHLARGDIGEAAAKRHLQSIGLRFLAANYVGRKGEIDLVFQAADCLVFVEVKARSAGGWTRPASAVNAAKQRRISQTALDYLQEIGHPRVRFRFDIVEVILSGESVLEVRHIINAFPLHRHFTYV